MKKVFGLKVWQLFDDNENIRVHIDDLDGEGISELYKDYALVKHNPNNIGSGKFEVVKTNTEEFNRFEHYEFDNGKEYLNKLLEKEVVNVDIDFDERNRVVLTICVSNEETAAYNRI